MIDGMLVWPGMPNANARRWTLQRTAVRQLTCISGVWRSAALLYAVLLLTGTHAARAAGVVGTGTAASCTDAALNAALADGGLVTFKCGGGPVTIDISVGTGTKPVNTDTTLDGRGQITISGGNAVPVFSVTRGVTFTVQNLTLANGSQARAIYNDAGTLMVTNSTFSDNSAGAIYNYAGTLTVTNSTFSDNSGGSIYNYAGTLTVTNSTFSNNSGAIYNDAGMVTVTSSTFSGNSAGSGGAIFSGGGILSHVAQLTVTNSTFWDNSAGSGGAIYKDAGMLTVTNSTFSGNSAGSGGAIWDTGTALLRNTIVANSPSGDNCSGSITDSGHNLDDGMTCGFSAASSLSGTDPQLDPAGLSNNGGPTQTVALCTDADVPTGCTATSPAIDAGDQAICAAQPVNNRDQRGFVRPGVGHTQCSIGAYEARIGAPGACVGDCDAGGSVTVDKIITLVSIALGIAELAACPAGIPNGAAVDVALILQAVNNTLSGCS
jgi:predicted outer membrane repeat protein